MNEKWHSVCVLAVSISFAGASVAHGQCNVANVYRAVHANDGLPSDFGFSVSVSGDCAFVGARGDDDGGAVYVYQRTMVGWAQVQRLTATGDPAVGAFGTAVAIRGEMAIVAAPQTTVGGVANAGAAFVFQRSSGGIWEQVARLVLDVPGADDLLGNFGVGIEGNLAVVGTHWRDLPGATDAGAVYVFQETNGVWQQSAVLTSANPAMSDHFGRGVAIDNGTVLVGANLADSAAENSGAAYVFRRVNGTWSLITELTAGDADGDERFGISVALQGMTAIVGARYESGEFAHSGAAYVFREQNGVWAQSAKLKPDVEHEDSAFGWSVSISGDSAIIGAPYEDAPGAIDAGAAYVFVDAGGVWQQVAYLTGDGAGDNEIAFGFSVSIDGDAAVTGAFQINTSPTTNPNSAYFYSGASCDNDRDGVPNSIDVCPDNRMGLPVDCEGRPLRDCNGDCRVDGADVQCIVNEMLGV